MMFRRFAKRCLSDVSKDPAPKVNIASGITQEPTARIPVPTVSVEARKAKLAEFGKYAAACLPRWVQKVQVTHLNELEMLRIIFQNKFPIYISNLRFFKIFVIRTIWRLPSGRIFN